jgi:hypothetical protein
VIRVLISKHATIEEARSAKSRYTGDEALQIRKIRSGFKLVKRISGTVEQPVGKKNEYNPFV